MVQITQVLGALLVLTAFTAAQRGAVSQRSRTYLVLQPRWLGVARGDRRVREAGRLPSAGGILGTGFSSEPGTLGAIDAGPAAPREIAFKGGMNCWRRTQTGDHGVCQRF